MPYALLWASLAENIFIIAIQENLRIFLNCFFTVGVVKANGSCHAGFLRKHLRGGENSSVIACGDATFPKSSYPNPTCENGVQKRPQAFLNPEIKIIFPLMMRRATRSAFQIVFTQGGFPHTQSSRCTVRRSGCFVYSVYRKGG